MSLANIEGKLSRAEMKNVMAGTGGSSCSIPNCCSITDCIGTCSASGHTCTCTGTSHTLTKTC